MAVINLDHASIAREAAAFQAAAAQAAARLCELRDVAPGATPREAVFHRDKLVLYRYRSANQHAASAAILIVYALVNRPDMADLEHGRSLIAGLLAQGFDVFLIDWGYPDSTDRNTGLDDYINGYLDACVDYVRDALEQSSIAVLGICQGGTFSVCYAALHPHKVARLITTVTPIDFHTDADMLSHMVRHIDVTALVGAFGNISGDMLNAMFLSLKPYRLTQQKYLRMLAQLESDEALATFMRMEQWIFDSPALAGAACREFATEFYQHNKLVRGELLLGGRAVDPARISMPVLNIYARRDHLVPPDSSRALAALVASDNYREVELAGGHIGVYVSAHSKRSVPQAVADWMRSG